MEQGARPRRASAGSGAWGLVCNPPEKGVNRANKAARPPPATRGHARRPRPPGFPPGPLHGRCVQQVRCITSHHHIASHPNAAQNHNAATQPPPRIESNPDAQGRARRWRWIMDKYHAGCVTVQIVRGSLRDATQNGSWDKIDGGNEARRKGKAGQSDREGILTRAARTCTRCTRGSR